MSPGMDSPHQKVNLLEASCIDSQVVEQLLGRHDQHAVQTDGNAPSLGGH